jgi:RND family efflux transporter MFP subunit
MNFKSHLAPSILCGFSFFLSACPGTESKGDKAALPASAPAAGAQAETSLSPGSLAAASKTQQNSIAERSVTETPDSTGAANASALPTRISGSVVVGRSGMISFIAPGHLAKITVKVGDRVRKGEIVAQLQDADFLLRERMAAVAVQQAQIQFEQAKKELAREEQLKQENVSSVIALERTSNAFQSAKLGLEQAQISLEMAHKAVKDSSLAAPYEGIITKKVRSEGEWVGGGAPVLEMFESGDMEVSLRVPEAFLRKAQVGKTLTILVPSTGAKAAAKIVRVVPVVMEATRTFEVTAQFIKRDAPIYPGQFVEADLN